MHSQGALNIKLCTRKLLHVPSQYIAIINGSKTVHTPGANLLKSCTRPWKCGRRVQGAPLISDTVGLVQFINHYSSGPVRNKLKETPVSLLKSEKKLIRIHNSFNSCPVEISNPSLIEKDITFRNMYGLLKQLSYLCMYVPICSALLGDPLSILKLKPL